MLTKMIDKKRLAKSKKIKIELIRECINPLQIVTKIKTFENDLEEVFKKLKERYVKENYDEENLNLGSKNKPMPSPEDDHPLDHLKFTNKVKKVGRQI
jgi:hypothetical protein